MPYEKISNNIASALKVARTAKELTQEDFALVSSRTYLSTLERGMKSPTLNKLEDLAQVLEIHPLTLMALAYLADPGHDSPHQLLSRISTEIDSVRLP
jgi:transcriptional regulator with XRE-family HTH domain